MKKRVYVLLPKTMHEQIWRTSGKLKVNLVCTVFDDRTPTRSGSSEKS